ncbi:MAG: preprotein translocase subunit SecY [Candidatus Aenigmatarchaeota archaeon]
MNYRDLLGIAPGIEGPKKRLNFNDKLKWTGIIVIIYFVMGQITVWGVSSAGMERFEFLQTVVASDFGSLITLGIVPIVNASIILQLLTGSEILQWDTNTPEGKKLFMGTQKLLAIVFCVVQAIAFVSFGAVPAQQGMTAVVITQIAAGGILIVLMDEVISKWGFGSGVSLFIASGVSMQIIVGLFNPIEKAGKIPALIDALLLGSLPEAGGALIPIIFTVLVFLLVIYLNSMKVEIPLAFGQVKGFGQRYPLNFLYTSVIPIIFTHALLANLNIMGQMLADKGTPLLGTFGEGGIPESGLLYWIYSPQAAAPRDGLLTEMVVSRITEASLPEITIAWFPYAATVCALTIIFSVFWSKTSGQDAGTVAERIHDMGMSVPGYRRDKRIIKRILDRYIPYLAVLSGFFIGLLSVLADFVGAVGGGIGILLATMIIYRLYEELAQQHMEDMHPALRQFMGK